MIETLGLDIILLLTKDMCAKMKDMESYIIPTLAQNPETIIIHSGTNDLRSDSFPEEITRDINLTIYCKT